MVDKDIWSSAVSEDSTGQNKVPEYSAVKVYLSAIDISKINSDIPIFKRVILPDGREMDLEIWLNIDRDTFNQEIKEMLQDEVE